MRGSKALAQQIAGRRSDRRRRPGRGGPRLRTRPLTDDPLTRGGRRRARVASPAAPAVNGDSNKKSTLREQALADAGVQALLDVFPAEIRDVEEM